MKTKRPIMLRAVASFAVLLVGAVLGAAPATANETSSALVVNGHQLTAAEEANVRWIAENTVPRISGDREGRLDAASQATWWTLKEGVLGLENPHGYSNCDNVHLDPLEGCEPQCCWQVGIGAIQTTTWDPARAEEVAQQLYPGESVDQILAHTASYSGYPEGSEGHDTIVNSTGGFRNSWVLRNHGVAFELNAPQVKAECIDDSLSWCYGTGWDTTEKYAPNKEASMGSIADLRAILDQLAP